MHASQLANIGIHYLGDLQLDDLCQLHEELDILWKSGNSQVANNLYDRVVDSIAHETSRLNNDPYDYAVKKTDSQLDKLVRYLTQLNPQREPRVYDTVWDILNQELSIRSQMGSCSTVTFPPYWTAASITESPVQLIPLSQSSQEFQDLSNFFAKSLEKPSTVVYSITRIQNVRLWHIHQQLQKVIPHGSRRLIHGTASPLTQKLIMYHGFCRSYCPGGLIGDGVYFAVNASYSNSDPYVLKRTAHRRELFICQVLLGNSSQGSFGLKSPAPGCHSVFYINGPENDQFCIFNHSQAYPEYVIQYDHQ
ncbi:unnamed protein product [Didymodactylos carnosus]|uniref:Poly [ADP-ribose] polymerase n=1 Tax=Didymodactylos carnosus TaxID=1234261 RepID=A0A814EQA1_9BILA|nr:unnamed protein product [Didymodactylos carnosus]CAF0972268.1 unnamed protein product [Didymodactylos carnosus]CAF3725637.1 unnamed protein product [Didymodactylos carnosus]CAF3745271.1 unnamed protein product [Didymodactylos carnosus]